MYLHNDFIKLIKEQYHHAHSGNVCQLLEALNKLARYGQFTIEENYAQNCKCAVYRHEDGRNWKIAAYPHMRDDIGCMHLCKWAGSILQALRAEGVQC